MAVFFSSFAGVGDHDFSNFRETRELIDLIGGILAVFAIIVFYITRLVKDRACESDSFQVDASGIPGALRSQTFVNDAEAGLGMIDSAVSYGKNKLTFAASGHHVKCPTVRERGAKG